MKNPIFSKINSPTEKVLETNSHYFLRIYKLSIEHFYPGPIVWPKFAKIRLKKMRATPKSSTYGALQPKPWVVLKNLIYHFVHYNLLNKLSAHHNSVGSIFFEQHHFSLGTTPETKIFGNFSQKSNFLHTISRIDKPQKLTCPIFYAL